MIMVAVEIWRDSLLKVLVAAWRMTRWKLFLARFRKTNEVENAVFVNSIVLSLGTALLGSSTVGPR